MAKPAVIVVNSHVVRGSVGGRSAVFALERLGFPVWSLATVSLSWHPGHGLATRVVPDDAAFAATVGDLAGAASLGKVGAVLVGYLGSVGQVAPLVGLVGALRRRNSAARFLYDPNIGDNGTLFQPAAVAAEARDRLLPLADIATPNRFELGWLSGLSVNGESEIASAAGRLGPREVVVTSAVATETQIATMLFDQGKVTTARHEAVAGAEGDGRPVRGALPRTSARWAAGCRGDAAGGVRGRATGAARGGCGRRRTTAR